jgi:hypothetical protein
MSGTRRKAGRLGPQVEGYRVWLADRGYTPATVRNMLKDLGQAGVWISGAGLEAVQLDEHAMAAFLASRQAAGRRQALGRRAMIPLLSYLREVGVTPAAKPPQTRMCWWLSRSNAASKSASSTHSRPTSWRDAVMWMATIASWQPRPGRNP